MGDVQIIPAVCAEGVVEDFRSRRAAIDHHATAGAVIERVVDDADVLCPARADARDGAAVNQVVDDRLPVVGGDPHAIERKAGELDRAIKISADLVGFDQVRGVKAIGAQQAAPDDAGDIAVDVLLLHPPGVVDADGVVEDVVRARAGEVAQTADGIVDRHDQAGGIGENAVGDELLRHGVIDAQDRGVDVVVVNGPIKRSQKIEPHGGRGDALGQPCRGRGTARGRLPTDVVVLDHAVRGHRQQHAPNPVASDGDI